MNPELPYDPTITLRLELGRVTDQRDAFEKAFSTEVLKVVRVAIIQATISSDDEIARLKAEVERLKNNCAYLDTKLDEELDK
jgi:uncharacterized small protein (DUF1192 family)